jgi:hypothetical protein
LALGGAIGAVVADGASSPADASDISSSMKAKMKTKREPPDMDHLAE